MLIIVETFVNVHPSISRVSKLLHPKNILAIFVTFDVSQPLNFTSLKALQPSNNSLIVVIVDLTKLLKSILVKDVQFLNILDIFVRFTVFHPFISPTLVKLLHPQNIECIISTFDVTQLLKSKVVKLLQPLNISFILVTFDTFKFSIPIMSVNELQSLNIPSILATCCVLKRLTFKLVKPLHPLNILDISVTFDVFQSLKFKSKVVKPLHPLNILDIFVTFDVFQSLKFTLVKALQP